MGYLQKILEENKAIYAGLITQEMGKPIAQSKGEIDKCINLLQYYIDNSERFMQDEVVKVAN